MKITLNADEITIACIGYIESESGATVDAMGSGFENSGSADDFSELVFIAEIEEKEE